MILLSLKPEAWFPRLPCSQAQACDLVSDNPVNQSETSGYKVEVQWGLVLVSAPSDPVFRGRSHSSWGFAAQSGQFYLHACALAGTEGSPWWFSNNLGVFFSCVVFKSNFWASWRFFKWHLSILFGGWMLLFVSKNSGLHNFYPMETAFTGSGAYTETQLHDVFHCVPSTTP